MASLIVTAEAESPVTPVDWKAVKAVAYVLDSITAFPAVVVRPLTVTVTSVVSVPSKAVLSRVMVSLSTYPEPGFNRVTVIAPFASVTTLNVAPVPEPVDDACSTSAKVVLSILPAVFPTPVAPSIAAAPDVLGANTTGSVVTASIVLNSAAVREGRLL